MTMNADIGQDADRHENTVDRLSALAESGRDDESRELLASLHPADVAEVIDLIERAESRNRIFTLLAPDRAPTVLSLVSPAAREAMVKELSVEQLQQILAALETDDAADLLASVPS